MKALAAAAAAAVVALALAACKSDGSGGMIEAAASGDKGAVEGAATEAAKSEATAQAEAQVAEAAQAQQAASQAQAQAQGTLTKTTPSANYPTKTCIVSDEPLPASPVAYTFQGREVQFCCPGCASDFLKDPATYLAKLDAAR